MKEIFNSIYYFCDEFSEDGNFVTIKTKQLKSLCLYLFRDLDCDLSSVVALKKKDGFIIKYLYSYPKKDYFFIVEQDVQDEFESFTDDIPALNWFEREIYDLFGLKPLNHPDFRALSLHPENYPIGFHPMIKAKNEDERYATYEYKDIKSEGVYTIPVGPIHAGVIEPGHFRFAMSGEPILQLEIRHFWKHRGIEKLCENKEIDEVLRISQKISGDNAFSHALSFAMAVEKICGVSIPNFAKYCRIIGAELERISCNLSDFAGVFQDTGYSFGASGISALKEDIMRLMKLLSGDRFFKNFIIIGGVSRDITPHVKEIISTIKQVNATFDKYKKIMENSSSILERLETTGKIQNKTVKDLSCVGFTASASGRFSDFRKTHPYLAYDKLDFETLVLDEGDVSARVQVKLSDIKNSFEIIKICTNYISQVDNPQLKVKYEIKDGEEFGYAQSNRGNIVHFVKIKDKKVVRFKPRDPSFMNWQSIQFAVLGDVIGDFPLVNKSLNLSYAGNDL
jgi:Ni,Fe-hydrogenase III large subunit/Ni,Fe-hydrogenase III component G